MATKNFKLTLAHWLVRIIGICVFVFAALFFFVGIHLAIAPHHYDWLHLSSEIFIYDCVKGELVRPGPPERSLWTLWFFLENLIFYLILGVIFIYFGKILHSVRNGMVFRNEMPGWLRRIGLCFLIIAPLVIFHIGPTEKGFQFGTHMHLGYLLAGLFAFVLAEIFKEGSRLNEESKLTV